ncbi:MAG TPA: dihydrofolate reductase family protein [Gaiellaceae bacterium]|jgi:dihydrofolate reductase
MPKITVTEYVSLDGVFDEPGQWSFPFWTDEAAKWKYDELLAADAQLLGRVTYEGFAVAWPTMEDEAGFADRMNGMPKYVVSSTLTDPAWTNTKVITVDEITDLPAENLLVAGSGQLVDSLFREGLVDEFRLLVHPIVLGSGKQLFHDGLPTTSLALEDQQTFSSGVLALTYRRPTA